MNKTCPPYKADGTTWRLDLCRACPVVHERRPDGTSITHIRPRGGKSAVVNQLIEQLRTCGPKANRGDAASGSLQEQIGSDLGHDP